MFNKKLISTVLSALTIFSTASPLVSANGSQAEQPKPSATASSSAPDTAYTGTVSPAQKRPREVEPNAEPKADSADATTPEHKRPRSKNTTNHFAEATKSLNAVKQFTLELQQNADANANYMFFNFVSRNYPSSSMDKLYTKLGELIVHLDNYYTNRQTSEHSCFKEDVDSTLTGLHTTVLNALKNTITRNRNLNYYYVYLCQHVLKGEDLFSTNTNDMCSRFNTLIAHPTASSNIIFFSYTYLYSLANVIMKSICDYFHDCKWKDMNKTVALTSESARNHLMTTLSSNLKSVYLKEMWPSDETPCRLFSYITSTKKILNLEVSNAGFDIHPGTLIGALNKFDDLLLSKEIFVPYPHRNFIELYLTEVCCCCPINSVGTPTRDKDAIKSKLRDVNTKFFRKIEKDNFDKVPGLEKALYNLSLECGKTIFRSDLSPDEYYEKFTYKILTSKSLLIKSPDIYIRLCKLSILANILICIQSAPFKNDLQPLLKELVSKLEKDVPKALSSMPDVSNLLPFIWVPPTDELLSDFNFNCFPCDLFTNSNFFNVLTTKPEPNSILKNLLIHYQIDPPTDESFTSWFLKQMIPPTRLNN